MENWIWIVSIISSIFNICKEYIFHTFFGRVVKLVKKNIIVFMLHRKMKIQFERSCRSQHNKFSQQSIKIYFLTEEDKNLLFVHVHVRVHNFAKVYSRNCCGIVSFPCVTRKIDLRRVNYRGRVTAPLEIVSKIVISQEAETPTTIYISARRNEERTTMGKRSIIMIAMMDR